MWQVSSHASSGGGRLLLAIALVDADDDDEEEDEVACVCLSMKEMSFERKEAKVCLREMRMLWSPLFSRRLKEKGHNFAFNKK